MNLNHILLLFVLPLALTACGSGDDPNAAAVQSTEAAEHAENDHDDARIVLSAMQVEKSGIVLEQAGPAQIRESLSLYGVIAPNAERVRDVAARFPGAIRSVAKKIGDSVREGETLATVEANESLQVYSVSAPIAGVVSARNANPGEQTGDKTLFTVADLSTVWVELSLFPRDVAKVRVGQRVRVRGGDTGLESEGDVVYVAPFGQSVNQTLTARVLLDNPERHWAPGLHVTAEVALSDTAVPLAIRNDALQTIDGHSVVFVRRGDSFEPSEVVLGRSDGEYSEVNSGVTVGETYAAANSFILKAELGKGEAAHED
jgi:cobalt-zinc-cadmium efflux system membrane fusion protein